MLARLLSNYIKKIKGHDYGVDNRIPTSYLFSLIVSRSMMKVRGALSGIESSKVPFIGPGVRLRVKSKIVVGRGVTVDSGCHIDALSIEGVKFGNNVSVGPNTRIECTGSLQNIGKGLRVGNSVGLGANNFYGCAGGVIIGDDTIIGNFVSFHSENHVFSDLQRPIRLQGVTHQGIKIGNNCWIGAKATILDGVTVEDGCIIAAGALVKAGVYKKNGIYGGVPAKLIKYRSDNE
jgi:acetyltransferase-like isoleucine patch superfamily enzyme